MIKIVPVETSHIAKLKPKSVFLANPNWESELSQASVRDLCVSFMDQNNDIIAILGMQMLWPKVGEFWSVTSDLCYKYPIAYPRNAKLLLDGFSDKFDLKRAQMTIRSKNDEEMSFALFLGFEPEGILKAYGPENVDYVMMGRTF